MNSNLFFVYAFAVSKCLKMSDEKTRDRDSSQKPPLAFEGQSSFQSQLGAKYISRFREFSIRGIGGDFGLVRVRGRRGLSSGCQKKCEIFYVHFFLNFSLPLFQPIFQPFTIKFLGPRELTSPIPGMSEKKSPERN